MTNSSNTVTTKSSSEPTRSSVQLVEHVHGFDIIIGDKKVVSMDKKVYSLDTVEHLLTTLQDEFLFKLNKRQV